MLKKSLLKNSFITIFEDWENEKDIIGTVCLIKKVRNGLPFILKDTEIIKVPKKETFHSTDFFRWSDEEKSLGICKVYNYERWVCKMIKPVKQNYAKNGIYTFNIRYMEGIYEVSKIFSQYNKDDDEEDETSYKDLWKNKNLMDEFISVNGEQIY